MHKWQILWGRWRPLAKSNTGTLWRTDQKSLPSQSLMWFPRTSCHCSAGHPWRVHRSNRCNLRHWRMTATSSPISTYPASDGDLDQFFSHENQATPPSLSNAGIDAAVLDGACIVRMLNPSAAKTFQDYADSVFMPYLSSQLEKAKRIDVIGDV